LTDRKDTCQIIRYIDFFRRDCQNLTVKHAIVKLLPILTSGQKTIDDYNY